MDMFSYLSSDRYLVFSLCLTLTCLTFTVNAYDCYECSAATPTDSCSHNVSIQTKTSCFLPGFKCKTTRVTDLITGNQTSIKRSCSMAITLFEENTKCCTSKNVKTCEVVCDHHLCNTLLGVAVDKCAETNCNRASLPIHVHALTFVVGIISVGLIAEKLS